MTDAQQLHDDQVSMQTNHLGCYTVDKWDKKNSKVGTPKMAHDLKVPSTVCVHFQN